MGFVRQHGAALYSAGLFLLIGFVLGYGVQSYMAARKIDAIKHALVPIQEPVADPISLIHPLLGYRVPEAVTFGDYVHLKETFSKQITRAQKNGEVSRVSVYFRDLNSAGWVGINQNDTYYPASLLKVPVMIAYYRMAEVQPSLLSQVVTFNPIAGADPFEAPSRLVAGNDYTIENLIEHMIIDSDNGATFTLLAHIDENELHQVYTDLGIDDPGEDSSVYQIPTRTYALFFRILYNTTYLSPKYSEKALALLTRSTFVNGMVAGVPSKTRVANKFGEHVLSSDGKTVDGVELHDCGIIYYPSHPYLLCVMTSARDLDSASSIIADISRSAYAAVAAEYP